MNGFELGGIVVALTELAPLTWLEIVAVAFALAYLLLAIRQSLWCWPAALISVALSMVLFYEVQLYMESALQIFYFAMGIYGWVQWQRGGETGTGVEVHWWRPATHVVTLALILVLTAAFGWFLNWRAPDAAWPYLDSFTTVGAIVTTYMVARKVIENWIYWLVIDSVSIFLYLDRGLPLYAALYGLYLVMIVIGFWSWYRSIR